MARQSRADVKADAEAAFIQALEQALAGSVDVTSGEPGGPDLYVSVPGGPTFAVEVKGIATRAEPGPVANALKTWDRQLASVGKATGDDVIGVVVAAALPDAAKGILRDHGWGWFDRRGELHLRAPGLVVHTTEITPDPAAGGRVGREPIRGRAGITTAAGLLLDPDDPPGVREIARQGDLAPSSVSAALTELRTASLVDDRDRPLVPELFWALAGAWKPERHAFAELPEPGAPARLALGLESVEEPGWAVGGTVGAAAWSAPVAVASVAPPDFYVPSERELRAARRELPPAGRLAERACTIAVAPTILAVRPRYEPATTATAWLAWPLVRPLFVALDLAQDRARGVEILADWIPPEPFRRVW